MKNNAMKHLANIGGDYNSTIPKNANYPIDRNQ